MPTQKVFCCLCYNFFVNFSCFFTSIPGVFPALSLLHFVISQGYSSFCRISYLLTPPKHIQAFLLCLPPWMDVLQEPPSLEDVAQVREKTTFMVLNSSRGGSDLWGKKFCPSGVVGIWNELPREVEESLEVFRRCLDVALGVMMMMVLVGLDDPQGLFPPWFHNSRILGWVLPGHDVPQASPSASGEFGFHLGAQSSCLSPHLLQGTVLGLNSAKIPPEPQILTPLLLGWFWEWQGLGFDGNSPCGWVFGAYEDTKTPTKWTSPSVRLRTPPLPKRTINARKKPEKWLSLWPFQGLSFSWHTHYLQNQMCLSKHYSDVCFGPQRSDSWPLTRWQWSIPAEILSLGLFIPRSISASPASPATFCCWGAFKANNNPIWDWSMAACGQ